VLGKHSGRHAFRQRLSELGYDLSDNDLNRSFVRFKELADKKKEISNADLESIVNDEMKMDISDRFKMVRIQVLCGDSNVPTATATLRDERDGKETTHATTGTGPVDAAFKALREQIAGANNIKLLEYTVSSVTAGIDALGEVTVRLQDPSTSKVVFGRSANTDVIVASAQAYLNAVNRIMGMRESESLSQPTIHPQFGQVY
jgi:2-isopropylmalate synthase